MIREFRSISEVNGPLVFVEGVSDAAYGELVEFQLKRRKYVMVKYWRPLIVFLWSKFLKGPRV